MPQFNVDYLSKVRGKLDEVDRDFIRGYTVDIAGDVTLPPVLEIVRYLTEYASGSLSPESKERILRTAIIGKQVTISYRGKQLGAFTMNQMSDLFDAYEVS